MKRTFRLSLCGATVAAMGLLSLAGLSAQRATADEPDDTEPPIPVRPRYYYGGGTGSPQVYSERPRLGYTSSYGYADPSPGVPLAPSYRGYGLGNGFGTGGTYRGVYGNMVDHSYGRWRFYREPSRPAYTPYGSAGYGPYRFSVPHDYGY